MVFVCASSLERLGTSRVLCLQRQRLPVAVERANVCLLVQKGLHEAADRHGAAAAACLRARHASDPSTVCIVDHFRGFLLGLQLSAKCNVKTSEVRHSSKGREGEKQACFVRCRQPAQAATKPVPVLLKTRPGRWEPGPDAEGRPMDEPLACEPHFSLFACHASPSEP
jgi:hypothetical protein